MIAETAHPIALLVAMLVLLFAIGVPIFGYGALLWVGARYITKLKRVTYWRCVGTILLAALVGTAIGWASDAFLQFILPKSIGPLVGSLTSWAFDVLISWWIISALLHTSFGKAMLAYLPTLAFSILLSISTNFLPFSHYNRELARRAMCSANLNGIYKSLIMYDSLDNKIYPPSFKELLEKTGQSKKLLKCPSDKSDREVDYFYLQPLSDTPETAIILCDYKDNHKGKGRNVGYVYGLVSWLTEEEFQAELSKPENAAFAKALAEAEKAINSKSE